MRHTWWIGVGIWIVAGAGCNLESKPATDGAAAPPAPTATERVEATAGVGKASKNRGDALFGTSLKAGVYARETIELDINLRHALDLYRAEKGYFPRTEDDFWKLVKEQQITLPKLPEGEKYVYEPEKGQLMVERPKQ